MSITFFAADGDLAEVWSWMLEFPESKVFEQYSHPDQSNRFFSSKDEISIAIASGAQTLAGWLKAFGSEPKVEFIRFNDETRRRLGAKGRTALHSPALITISRNNDQNGCLASSSLACWTEKGARQRSIYSEDFLDEVNWKLLASTVSKLRRKIIAASPAKLRSYPIMPEAFDRFVAGKQDLWNWGEPCKYPSPIVILK